MYIDLYMDIQTCKSRKNNMYKSELHLFWLLLKLLVLLYEGPGPLYRLVLIIVLLPPFLELLFVLCGKK